MKSKRIVFLSIITMLVIALSGAVTSVAAAQTSSTGTASRSSVPSTSTAAPAPKLSAPKLVRDNVYIDYSQSKILMTATNPNKVSVYLVGSMPDPCHVLRISQITSTSSNVINLEVYSLFDPTQACATVLQPFAVTYSLGSFSPGMYTVYVNGTELGKFGVSTSVSSIISR